MRDMRKIKCHSKCFHLIFRKCYLSCVLYTSPWYHEVCLLVAASGCALPLPLGVENSGPIPLFLFPKPWVSLTEMLFTQCIMELSLCTLQSQWKLFQKMQPPAQCLKFAYVPLSAPPNHRFTLYFWILWLILPSHTLWIYTHTQVTTTQIKIYNICNSLEGSFVPPSS